jgi:hypothetical protein
MTFLTITPPYFNKVRFEQYTVQESKIKVDIDRRRRIENLPERFGCIIRPLTKCYWHLTDNNTRLVLEKSIEYNDVQWLLFLIYQCFAFSGFFINGFFYYTDDAEKLTKSDNEKDKEKNNTLHICQISDNIVTFSNAEVQNQKIWNPQIITKELKSLSFKLLHNFLKNHGLDEWKILTNSIPYTKLYIDLRRKIIYIKEKQLYAYSKKHGIRHFIENLRRRIQFLKRLQLT